MTLARRTALRLRDNATGYGWISIAFHWIVAVFVIYLFVNGKQLEEADSNRGAAGAVGEGARRAVEGVARAGGEFARRTAAFVQTDIFANRPLHISIGMIALVFIVGRIVWRLTQGQPPKGNDSPALNIVATLVQWGLLVALVVLMVTGPLMNWAVGQPIPVFNWFSLSSPMAAMRTLRQPLELAHGWAADALIPLLALHVLGALKHALIDRDGVLRRMIVPARA